MLFALWIVGAYVVVVYLGTWTLQIALWLLQAAWVVFRIVFVVLAGFVGFCCLLMTDRAALKRMLHSSQPDVTLDRGRWT